MILDLDRTLIHAMTKNLRSIQILSMQNILFIEDPIYMSLEKTLIIDDFPEKTEIILVIPFISTHLKGIKKTVN